MYNAAIRIPRILLLAVTVAGYIGAEVQQGVEYRNRGNHYEGVKNPLRSGYPIELISALVHFQEQDIGIPDRIKIRFFLKHQSPVFVTVREIDVHYNYWLDKVSPLGGWQTGFNDFEWSAHDVIQRLNQITSIYELGIVVRLRRENPLPEEFIAPAILYHISVPTAITSYVFTFRPNGDARLECKVYRQDSSTFIFRQSFPSVSGGEPFTLEWDGSRAEEGNYKVVIHGYFSQTNDQINKVINFYHKK